MDELTDLLGEVSAAFQIRLQELPSLRDLGLAPFQARLLSLVARHPGCSQQELARWTGRDKAQIARTAKELEVRDLLARAAHRSDWRSHCLTITADGERAYVILSRERSAMGSEATRDLDPEERAAMVRALRKMKCSLTAVPTSPTRD